MPVKLVGQSAIRRSLSRCLSRAPDLRLWCVASLHRRAEQTRYLTVQHTHLLSGSLVNRPHVNNNSNNLVSDKINSDSNFCNNINNDKVKIDYNISDNSNCDQINNKTCVDMDMTNNDQILTNGDQTITSSYQTITNSDQINTNSDQVITNTDGIASVDGERKYAVVSFYQLEHSDRSEEAKESFRETLKELDVTGRIYYNKTGVNGQMSVLRGRLEAALLAVTSHLHVHKVHYKLHFADGHVFKKLRVRYGKLVEGMDQHFSPSNSGRHLTADEWDSVLSEKDKNTVVLDIRNCYEWDIGHFEGAERPQYRKFNRFKEYADQLQKRLDKGTRVLMYCTGGIRCELFSAMLKDRGFSDVNQLKGGIIQYGLEKGRSTGHWRGNLFVFDDRLVVPVDGADDEGEVIARCVYCKTLNSTVYNCANTHCSEIFVSCPACARQHLCCCSEQCRNSDALQPFRQRNGRQIDPMKYMGRGKHFRQMLEDMGEEAEEK